MKSPFFVCASFSHAFRWSTTNKSSLYFFTTPTGLTELSCLEGIRFCQSIMPQIDALDLARIYPNPLDVLEPARIYPSPLDQFSIIPLIPMKIGNLYFSFTNPSLFMLLTLSLVLLLVYFVTKKGGGNSVPNAWQSLVELIYDFVPNLVNEQIGGLSGNVKQKFFPRISVTFTFSLFRNPQCMIPLASQL